MTTLDGASYTYDLAGNRTSKTDLLANVTSNYSYDAIYELTGVTQGPTTTESYTYDKVGNRLSSLGMSPYAYNSSNELTSTPAATYTYDKDGDVLTKVDSTGTTTYTWGYENPPRLKSIALPGSGGTVTFKYDPFGRRIQKSGPLGTTNYLYDGPNLLEEVDQSGNVLARYSQSTNIDEPLSVLRSGTTSYYEQDANGSVSSLSSPAGLLGNTYTYDSFGVLTASTGMLTNPIRYAGREFDGETGIYFYRFRYYDQNRGRFLSEDRIAFDGGTDFYSYLSNDPVQLVDPFGLGGKCHLRGGCGPSPIPPPPLPNPIPNWISGDYAAFQQCIGPDPWKGCGTKTPRIPIPKPDFQDPFGNGALPPTPVAPTSSDMAISHQCECLRQHPMAALDPRFNNVPASCAYPLFSF